MKRLLQLIGIRKWSGEDLISLQAEPLKTIDAFFAEYGNCIFNGCEVSAAPGNTFNIAPGFVALQGKDQNNQDTFKVAPFAGLENATLPVYLTLSYNVIEKEYVDGKVKPVAYDYYAAVSSVRPTDVPYLEITASGGRRFIDAIGITRKLDQTGNGRDVTVTFNPAAGRENVSSGDKLTTILGKVARWFTDLKTVAFSGKTADLTDDAAHRFTSDIEKVGWNDKYTKTETDNKDVATLTAAKNYTDVLDGKVYKKTETYTRAETDTKVATLGNEVYRKGEVYTRFETDAKDTATLNAAKQYVLDRIAEIVGGSPAALDTLYEIAKALGNDPNFATSIMALVNGKASLVHTHTKSQITDFPSSMPASDVYSWAKQPTKPAYNAGEVGAASAIHNHPADQITDTDIKVMMTVAERSKLAELQINPGIKDISNFHEAATTGVFAVQGNAAGGPMVGNLRFGTTGCLKIFYYTQTLPPSESETTPIPDRFLLKEFTVKRDDGTVFYFIRYEGITSDPSCRWIQILPMQTSEIQTAAKSSYDDYTETGKYYVFNVPGGPSFNSFPYFALLEVEVLPNGTIYQTVKNITSGIIAECEIHMRAFCSASYNHAEYWSQWVRIFPVSTPSETPSEPSVTPSTPPVIPVNE